MSTPHRDNQTTSNSSSTSRPDQIAPSKIRRTQVGFPRRTKQDRADDTIRATAEASDRFHRALAWVHEQMPDEPHPTFAADAALKLKRNGRRVTPELVRAQLRLDHPNLKGDAE